MTTVITQSSPTDAARPRPTGPNPWLVIGGVVTALLLAAGILNAVGWLNYRTEVQQTVYVQTAESIAIDIAAGMSRSCRASPARSP
jgi:hypothetical protein